MDKTELRALVMEILSEQMGGEEIRAVRLPDMRVNESDRLDTGRSTDRVYTHDLFTLQQSPRLGAGLMEMEKTTFDWTLSYDEIDYIIEGTLSIICNGKTTTAHAGEVLLIPNGSKIQFSAPDFARFLYVTYPADWQNQA